MRICSVDGCEKKHKAHGYCEAHYCQIRKYGRIIYDKINSRRFKNKICLVEGCNWKSPYKDNYCRKHHYQITKHGKIMDDIIEKRKNVLCSVERCNCKAGWQTKLCRKHYTQKYVHGKILERTKYTPNRIIIYKEYAEIEIYDRFCKPIALTKIDLEDVEKVKGYKWSDSHGYIITSQGKKHINLADLLMNFKGGRYFQIDHKNRDKLDNRKINLRKVTQKENSWNRDKSGLNTSGHIGVSFDKHPRHNCWIASINNERIGCFKSKEDAIEARIKAKEEYEKKIYGDGQDEACNMGSG